MASQTITCTLCTQHFDVTEDDQTFYAKMDVPIPNLCPDCRFRRRSVFRNEMTLYPGTCALCKKSIVTMYHPKSGYTVYCNECFESDKWDAKTYARDYDKTRPFFEQLGELFKVVPKKALYITSGTSVNSEYTNVSGNNTNCYLTFNTAFCEDTMYSRGMNKCRDVVDAYFGIEEESCYEVINSNRSYGVVFGQNATNCTDSFFLLDCSDCSNCFGCVNLRHKSYCFYNEQLTEQEYKKRVAEVRGSYSKMLEARKKFEALTLTLPRRATSNLKNEDCLGDFIFESKNVQNSFEVTSGEDCKYLFSSKFAQECYDLTGYGYDSELMLEGVGTGYSQRIIACYWTENSSEVEYSYCIRASQNCFGCNGLIKSQYCILNKEYSEEEYKKLRSEIIETLKKDNAYGLFFPPSLAPAAYNEALGQDNLPLTKEEALKFGFRWEDELPFTKGKETLKADAIPDNVSEVEEDILKQVLACTECQRNYKITKPEFAFYKKMVLPIPRKCFNCRHADRLKRRGPFTLTDRKCDNCKKAIKTTFSPDRPEVVYCEECYQKEVV